MNECLESPWVGYLERDQTLALILRGFYWPNIFKDVDSYVRSCLLC